MDSRTIIASSITLSEAPGGTRTLSIPSKTETIVIEISPEVWAKLSDTAKWFHERERAQ